MSNEQEATTRLATVRMQRERGDLKQVLARYGAIDQQGGPLWDDVELVLEIARAYSLVGNDAKVEQYFLRCAQLHPRRGALYRCQIGWFFQRKKRWARALTWYDRALETFPGYHLCLFRKGYCLERLHRPRAAAAALELARASYEKAPLDQRERSRGIQVQILFHLARNLREIGLTQRAREALDRCAEIDDQLHERVIKPEHRLASYGETYLHDRDPATALIHLEAARELDPHSAVIWERLGRAFQQAGRLEEAERALIRATELPKGAVALIALGRLYMNSGRPAEAARALAGALKLHPQGEVQIRMELAELQVTIGRPQAALIDLERLAGRVPPQSTLAVAVESRIAAILLDHGCTTRVLAHLQAAVAHDPEDGAARARLERFLRDHEDASPAGRARPFDDRPLPPEVGAVLGEQDQPRLSGQVSNYFPARGFGFITHGDDAGALFFHVSHCEPAPPDNLGPGLAVSFVIGVNHRSRKPQAEHVRVIEVDADLVDAPATPAAALSEAAWQGARADRQGTI